MYTATVGDECAYKVLKDKYLDRLRVLEDGLKDLEKYLANATRTHSTKGDWFKLVNRSAAKLEKLSESIVIDLKRIRMNETGACK
jgi:hypothetical protein